MSLAEEQQQASAPTNAADPQRAPRRAPANAPATAEAEQPAFDDRGAEPAAIAPKPRSKRKLALGIVALAVLLGGIAYGVYWWLVLAHYESTDNAYVQGNVVQLTPQIAGTVIGIYADDTDFVKAGQPLVKLDPADAQVALDQAEAQLAQAVREVRTTYVNNGALRAQVAARRC